MKLGMTLGLIGGILALLLGLVIAVMGSTVGGIASQFGQSGAVAKTGLLIVASLGLPVMAIVGAALLPNKTNMAVGLMAVPAALFLLAGLTGAGLLAVAISVLIGGGAAAGWNASKNPKLGE
ncbi:MAG: hypothetical protein R3D97_03200 [Paracoccaceae bacterium]